MPLREALRGTTAPNALLCGKQVWRYWMRIVLVRSSLGSMIEEHPLLQSKVRSSRKRGKPAGTGELRPMRRSQRVTETITR
jgi:hypothetical protein